MHFHMIVRQISHWSHESKWMNKKTKPILAHAKIKIYIKLLNTTDFQWFKAKPFSTAVSAIVMHTENSVFSSPWTHISHLYGECWVINIKTGKIPGWIWGAGRETWNFIWLIFMLVFFSSFSFFLFVFFFLPPPPAFFFFVCVCFLLLFISWVCFCLLACFFF